MINQTPTTIGFKPAKTEYTTSFNKGMIEKLQFPNDLGSSHRPNYIVIYINEVEGTKYSVALADKISTDNPVSSESNSGSPSMTEKSVGSSIERIGVQIARAPSGFLGAIAGELAPSHFKRLTGVIALPMPIQFNAPLNVIWSMNDSTNANPASAAFDVTGGALVRSLAESKGGASALRMVTNQAQEASFQNVSQRAFDMTWELYPKNIQEAKAIWDIIQVLKAFVLPSLDWGGGALKSPALFDFEFHHNGKRNDWLPKSTSCAIVNINANYTMGQGFQGIDLSDTTFEGFAKQLNGSPSTGMSLTIAFNEIEVLTRDRIDPAGDFTFNIGVAKEGASRGIY